MAVNGAVLSNGVFRKLGALVPQDDTLLPGLTVRQTLYFGAALRLRKPRAVRRARAGPRACARLHAPGGRVYFQGLTCLLVCTHKCGDGKLVYSLFGRRT